MLPVRRVRDLTVMELDDERLLVIACDSVGSIGPKPADRHPVSARTAAHFAARVPLVEVIAAGARPEILINTLSVEMNPTGAEMIAEFQAIAAGLGLESERVTGSTEDNVPSDSTGIGVTVLASATRDELRPGRARPGDKVLCVGRPTSAPEDHIVIDDPRLVSLPLLAELVALPGVGDALPVGSRGVGYELGVLADTNGLTFLPVDHELDLARSGGPASCVLLTVRGGDVARVHALTHGVVPVTYLGDLS
ncbi:MAG TPA: hypothetical protein VL043_10730 [Protaetiibacter sp.]|nr:hypothetical protein [Protaetiibacter sp.]